MNENIEKLLLTIEMDFWWRVDGKFKIDKEPNRRIRETMNVKLTLVEYVKMKQFIWLGHIERMSNDRLPKQILAWSSLSRRSRRS